MAHCFIFLCLLIATVIAQAPQNPIRDVCRRYGHQTTIIDRKLYIDGGWVYANPIAENPVPTISDVLLYGDLDRTNTLNFPTVYANLSKNNSIPDVSGGILWADQVNKVFWLYGGEYSTAPSSFQLWGFDTVLNQWNLSSAAANAASKIQRVSYGAGTTVNELGRGYYYGGYLNSLTNPLWNGPPFATNSLIVFDMDQNTLTNTSGPIDGYGRAEGVMVSIPASSSGMLVYFGGVSYPYKNSSEVPQSMEYVMLYDIGDQKWYTQRTTGTIPPNRRKFCGGVTWAADKSSYNIYIYGGFGFAENATGFDDVYILTMPSFQWIKWLPLEGDPNGSNPHGLLTCNVVDQGQMIIMGGNFTQHTDCDAPDVSGMHNLNLGQNDATDAMWYQYLPNITNYIVPPAIISVVGGSQNGGATKTAPPNGWSTSALSVYFGAKAQYQARTPTRSLPSSTSTSTSRPSSGSKAPIGAIVGGVVGGIALIIVALLAFCWFRRRGRQTTKPQPQPAAAPETTTSVLATELSGTSRTNEKQQSVSHVIGSSPNLHSPNINPYSATTLPNSAMSQAYPYTSGYHPQDPAYQQHHIQLSPPQHYQMQLLPHQQQQYPPQHYSPPHPYPPHQMYNHNGLYQQAPSPPLGGWSPGHQFHPQQYFPPPDDNQRISPSLQELPTAASPSPASGQPTMFYPMPVREVRSPSSPIRRREVGASSPTTTTVTHSEDRSQP